MNRKTFFVTAVAIGALVSMVLPARAASWMATKTAADAVASAGFVFGTPIVMTFRGPGQRVTPSVAYIMSYASLTKFKNAAPNLATGSKVLYDMESWRFTPRAQQLNPYASERSFVAIAHRHGFVVGLCPGRDFLPGGHYPNGAKVGADFFILQGIATQSTGNTLTNYVRLIRHQQSGELSVKVAVIPRHSLDFLLSQWRTLRRMRNLGYVLWGVRDATETRKAVTFLEHAQ
jgi:hypothetical protein